MDGGQQQHGDRFTLSGGCVERAHSALQAVVDGKAPPSIPEEDCDAASLCFVRAVNHLIELAADDQYAPDCCGRRDLVVEFAGAFGALTTLLAERADKLHAEIARREEAEERLQRERDLLVAGPLVTLRWDVSCRGAVEYVSPNIAAFGYDAVDFVEGRLTFADIVHPEDYAWLVEDGSGKAQVGMDGWTQEYRLVDAGGVAHWVRDYTHPVRDEEGTVTCFEGYLIDVTAQKQAEVELRRREEQLRMLSLADDVTGLYNRRGLFALGEHLLRQTRRHGQTLTVLYVDVDDLGRVNDELGHGRGDDVLRRVAAALCSATRDSDVVARAGGDEFVALIEAADDMGAELSRRLRRRLATPRGDLARGPKVSVSIGRLHWSPDQPADLQALIDGAAADLELRAAKA